MNGCYFNPRNETAILFYKNGLSIYSGVEVNKKGIDLSAYTKGQGWDLSEGRASIYGRYILKKDSITRQNISLNFETRGKVYTYKYAILSDTTIKSEWGDTLHFVPIENRMEPSKAWLLKKKWFWTKDAWENRTK